jgi:hypothetical protein
MLRANGDYCGPEVLFEEVEPHCNPQLGDIVPGVFTPVLAKHSKSFNLIGTLAVGVDRIQRNFDRASTTALDVAANTNHKVCGKAKDFGLRRVLSSGAETVFHSGSDTLSPRAFSLAKFFVFP